MTLRADLADLLTNQNVQAFLRVIRAGESSQTDDAYRTMVGGGLFEGFEAHPNVVVRAPRLPPSTAAGAYQFLHRTWLECQQAIDLPDFGPASQDLAALFLIRRRGALPDVLRGDLDAAIEKCSREWASLPGSPYGQPTIDSSRCWAVWREFGGGGAQPSPTPEIAPNAPPVLEHGHSEQPRTITMPTFAEVVRNPATAGLLSLVNPLLGLVPQIAGIFMDKGKTVPERNVAAAVAVAETAQRALAAAGKPAANMQQVVEAIATDPEARELARQAITAECLHLVEAGGGGIEGAARRNEAALARGPSSLLSPAFIISLVLMVLPTMMLVDVFFVHPDAYKGELRTQIVTGVLMVIGIVGGYWLGSSFGSTRKTELQAAK